MSFYLINCFLVVILAVQAESCTDSSTNCAAWKNSGYCTSTFYTDAQRIANCQLTCGLCPLPLPSGYGSGGSTSDCVDSSDLCAQWAVSGFCTSTTYTVSQKAQYCAKTCSLCPKPTTTSTTTTTTTTKPDPSCYDTSASCASWQTSGFCTSPYYTQEQKTSYCAKTCSLCKVATTTTAKPTTTEDPCEPSNKATTPKKTSGGGGGYGK